MGLRLEDLQASRARVGRRPGETTAELLAELRWIRQERYGIDRQLAVCRVLLDSRPWTRGTIDDVLHKTTRCAVRSLELEHLFE